MTFNWLSSLAFVVVPRRKYRAELRATWGRVLDSDNWLASRSFDLLRTDSRADWVDDRTWRDLEFPRIFSDLNTTITPIGRQYLYKQLRRYEYNAEILSQRIQAYEVLRADPLLRENLQLALKPLESDSTANIADALLGWESPKISSAKHWRWLPGSPKKIHSSRSGRGMTRRGLEWYQPQ
jgi:hypothetical protein